MLAVIVAGCGSVGSSTVTVTQTLSTSPSYVPSSDTQQPSPTVAATVDWSTEGGGASSAAPPPFPSALPGYFIDHSGAGSQWVRPSGWHAVESSTLPDDGTGNVLPLTHSSNKCGVEVWLLRWQAIGGSLDARQVVRDGTAPGGYWKIVPAANTPTYSGASGYLTGDNCTSPGLRNPGSSPVRALYQWQRYTKRTGDTGSPVTAATGDPIAPTFGKSDMTNFDPETATTIVTPRYSSNGAPTEPVQCFRVESTNSSPNYAVITNSDMAVSPQRDPSCHPSDDRFYLMRQVGSTWQDTAPIYGVNTTWTCPFQGALPFVTDPGARKDLCN